MSVIGTAQNSAGAAIDLIYHHKLNEHVEVASRSHDTPHFMTELMMPYLLCGRVCWINPDTAHQREVCLAPAVPGRCQSASWMVVFRWSKSRQSGATRELASNTNQIAKPIWNRGRAATLRRQYARRVAIYKRCANVRRTNCSRTESMPRASSLRPGTSNPTEQGFGVDRLIGWVLTVNHESNRCAGCSDCRDYGECSHWRDRAHSVRSLAGAAHASTQWEAIRPLS